MQDISQRNSFAFVLQYGERNRAEPNETLNPMRLSASLFLEQRPVYLYFKRAFDITFATALLVALSPVMLAIAIVVKRSSPGSIIFAQKRVGQFGRVFRCYKFRTMVENAESLLAESDLTDLFEKSWKLSNDPRVTPAGHWLRKLSLDELPQLVNVIRGDMSVVGPRPIQPREMESRYGSCTEIVTAVRPGLTSLWAVRGRSRLTYEERVDLDIEYVLRRGFWFDIGLVLRTIPPLLLQRGAV